MLRNYLGTYVAFTVPVLCNFVLAYPLLTYLVFCLRSVRSTVHSQHVVHTVYYTVHSTWTDVPSFVILPGLPVTELAALRRQQCVQGT